MGTAARPMLLTSGESLIKVLLVRMHYFYLKEEELLNDNTQIQTLIYISLTEILTCTCIF